MLRFLIRKGINDITKYLSHTAQQERGSLTIMDIVGSSMKAKCPALWNGRTKHRSLDLCLIAGGTAVAPCLSLLGALPPSVRSVHLIVSMKHERELQLISDRLLAASRLSGVRVSVYLTQEEEVGKTGASEGEGFTISYRRISSSFLASEASSIKHYFVYGSASFVMFALTALQTRQVPRENVYY